jgi:predicted nucleic acid-binding protein
MGATVQEALDVLRENCSAAGHIYWPMESPVTDLPFAIRRRMVGHQQVSDAILIDLAIRKNARLVTLDRRLRGLLPPGSQHAHAIEVLAIG